MAGGERRHADDMHVVLDRLAGGFLRRLEQRADIDVEAEIGEGGCDDLLPAVVAVLAHLGDQDARPAAVLGLETVDQLLDAGQASVHATDLRLVDPGDRRNLGPVAAIDLLQRIGDFADGRLGAGGLDGAFEQIAGACLGVFGSARQGPDCTSASLRSALRRASLSSCWRRTDAVVDFEDGDVRLAVGPVFVHPDDGLAA